MERYENSMKTRLLSTAAGTELKILGQWRIQGKGSKGLAPSLTIIYS